MIVGSVMTDHPSWRRCADAGSFRAVRADSSVWVLVDTPNAGGRRTTARRLSGSGRTPHAEVVDPSALNGPDALAGPLRALGTVARWRNPDTWDALATSIVRQVIRAEHAKQLYRSFSESCGEQVNTEHGQTWLFPTPATVLELPDTEFNRLGLAFKRTALRAAAEAVLEFGSRWAELDPRELVDAVQSVPRIGPWTAGAAIADLTNDYALYPYADLAVRTWAKRLAPERTWPAGEDEFARAWTRLAGSQLSDWTLLTLAWGVHHVYSAGGSAT